MSDEIFDSTIVDDALEAKATDIESKNLTGCTIHGETSEKSEELVHGCSHYRRKCQLVCPSEACGKIYTCRFCHDEKEVNHEFNRYEVKEVVCLLCNERQPVSPKCRNCSVLFGKYFCSICNLYNDEDRNQYHCHGCGLCRVGPAENFFHCPRCDMCFPTKLKGKHKCIERASRCPCAVCLEDIHTARTASHIPPCGHLIHQPCFEKLINTAHYTCPICNTSMIDMKAVWTYFDSEIKKSPMPPEYENTTVCILCRDCHKFSTIQFHFMGLKCGECGGYNTCIESRQGLPVVNTTNGNANNNNNNNDGINEVAGVVLGNEPGVQVMSNEDDIPLVGAVGLSESDNSGGSST